MIWAAALVGVAALALLAPRSYSLWSKQRAADRLQIGAISDARSRLEQAAKWSPNDGDIDMMLAFCFRQFRQVDRWNAALEAAERKGVSPQRIAREAELYRIQTGDWRPGTEAKLAALAEDGMTNYDVPAAFVSGCLAGNRHELAQKILRAWGEDSPGNTHVAHLWGKYRQSLGEAPQAEEQYQLALSLAPQNELAHLSLAEWYEGNDQLSEAREQYQSLAAVFPDNPVAAAGEARILRQMGHMGRASVVLSPFAAEQKPAADVAEEMGLIAMDRGDFQSAQRWLKLAGAKKAVDPHLLVREATLLALAGKTQQADRLFGRLDSLGYRATRTRDLRTRLTIDPGDAAAAREAEQLSQGLDEQSPSDSQTASDAARLDRGRQLFVSHCAACHGRRGDGRGRAGRHLFPPPRDLRNERSRLVSTKNGVPTLNDTVEVLRRGMPGTSMPSFGHLNEGDLRLLAEEVHELRRDGLREQIARQLTFDGEIPLEEDVEQVVEMIAAPGETIAVAEIGPPDAPSIRRGRQLYHKRGCVSCHGKDGTGASGQRWYDERGLPIRPRDLAHEFFKGGQAPSSIYLRIAAGMPGSPHPSNEDLSPESLIDLVHYCLSLSHDRKWTLTDHQRSVLAHGGVSDVAPMSTPGGSTRENRF